MSKMEYMPVDCLQVPKVLFPDGKIQKSVKYSKDFYTAYFWIV